jgi:chloramphenicol-sensitive protein RarD
MIYAASAYIMWGVIPVFWKLLASVSAFEILAHRIVWTIVFAGIVLWAMGRAHKVVEVLADRKRLVPLLLSSALIAMNWGLFIWAVNVGRIMDTSLGYYINPLISIALGVAVLGERLSFLQKVAVAVAGLGVLVQTLALGALPWISLTLAVSFALYGLIRKQVHVQSLEGMTIETLLMGLPAIGYLLFLEQGEGMAFMHSGPWMAVGLVAAGPLTAIPLLLFASGVRRIRLSTMGFLQYLAPSLSLTIAVFAYGEAFTTAHAVTFALIWTALALVTFDAVKRERRAVEP